MISTKKSNKTPILIAGGDSMTYGLDLLDCNPSNKFKHSMSTWTALIAKDMGREYVCTAYPGNSNPGICRRILIALEEYKDHEDIFVTVNWSFLNRIEFRFTMDPFLHRADAKTDPEGYALGPFGPWFNFNHLDIYSLSKDDDKNKLIRNVDPEALRFLQDYYRLVGSDDVYEYYVTLKEILLLQLYLKSRNIPYLFTSNYAFFKKTVNDPTVNCLLNQIDMDQWFFFPHLLGFLEWAYKNNFPKRDEHPSEEAHEEAFKLIREYLATQN